MRRITTISTQALRQAERVCKGLPRLSLLAVFIALLTFGLGGRASAQCSNMTLSTSPPAWNGFEFCTGYDPSTIGAPVINYSGTCSTTPVYNYYWQRRVNGGAYTTVTQGLGVAAVPGFNPAAETNTPAGNPMNTVQWRLLVDDIANSLSAQSGNFTIYIYSNLQAAIAVTNTCTNTGALDLTVNGGASSLTYSWAPGGQTTEDISGLTQGTYTVTVTDGGSCPSITAVATVRMPDVPPVLPADQNVTIACPAQAFAPPSPIVVDACGISLTGILNNPAGTYNGCEGTIVFTWTFTDAYPHTVVWTKTYTVERDDFTMPADDGALVSCPAATNTTPTPPTVTDNCGQTITPTGPTVSPAPTCNGMRTYIWNYQDCEGNNHNWTYTYTVLYSGGLSIPPNDGQTVSCPALAVDPGAPASVTDACGRTVTPVLLSSGTIPSCEGTVAYVYRYTTCDNANYDWTYTYTIERNDFSMPLNDGSVVSCPADANTVPTPPSVTDNCGNNITPSGPSDSGPVSCNGTRVYTWNYQDCEGNNHDWTYTYTVNYSGGLTAPANTSSTIQCQTDAVDPGAPAPITDACGRTVNAVLVSSGGGPAICNGSVIWTYRYTACDGTTTADWTHTYNVVHSTPPHEVGSASTGSTVQCAANAVASAITLPVFADVCGQSVTMSGPVQNANNTDTYNGCEGTISYTYTFTDCANLSTTWTYTYTVDLTTAPAEVGGPVATSSTINCGSSVSGAPALPVIQDACGNILTPSAPVTGGTYSGCTGTITFTYNYVDCANNPFSWTYTYNVTHGAPVVPADVTTTVQCLSDATAPTSLPTVNDACGNPITPSGPVLTSWFTNDFSAAVTLANSAAPGVWYTDRYNPNGFAIAPFGGNSRLKESIDAADAAANRPPAYSGAFYNTQGRGFLAGTATDYMETKLYVPVSWSTTNKRMAGFWGVAKDAGNSVSAYPIVEFTSDGGNPRFRAWESGSGTWVDIGLPSGFTYDSWVTLKIRLLASGEFLLTAGDKTYQTVTSAPDASVRIESTILQGHNYDPAQPIDPTNTGVTYDIYWDDFAYNDTYVAPACEGTVAYRYDYTDCSGMASQWNYIYNIDLTTPPAEVGGPVATSSIVACPGDAIASNVLLPVVQSHCGTVLVGTCPGAVNTTYNGCEGDITYTWTFTDCAGNSMNWTYTFTVEREDFALNMPADGGSAVTCVADAIQPTAPVVNDYCGNPMTGALTNTTPDPACTGTKTYTFTYTDCEGNTHNWNYVYTIDHTAPPAEVGGPVSTNGGTFECVGVNTPAPSVLPVVKDACGNTLSPTAGSPTITGTYAGCEGTYVYHYVYEDCKGYQFTWDYTYSIVRTTQITVPANGTTTVECLSQIPTSPAPSGPIAGYTYIGTVGGHTYYVSNSTDSWINASIAAMGLGGHLASISNAAENNMAAMAANLTGPSVWVGFSDAATEGSFVWTDGSPVTFTGWAAGEPNDAGGNEDYTEVYYDGSWNDLPNSAVYRNYLVEFDGLFMVTPPSVSDVCGTPITPAGPAVSSTYNGCEGNFVYTYTYTECTGYSVNWTQTFIIDHTTAPVVPANGTQTVQCDAQAVAPATPAVTDVCGNVITPVLSGVTVTGGGSGAGPGSASFAYSGSIVNWTVPAGVTSITINAKGAQGGSGSGSQGGKGANITGTVTVTPGETIKILVGGQGASAGNGDGGGGGGTFVWKNTGNDLQIAAGGGGGTSTNSNGSIGGDGSATSTPTSSYLGSGNANGGVGGNGGDGGAGSDGGASYPAGGGGGAGWLTDGGTGSYAYGATGGASPLNGGAGGFGFNPCSSTNIYGGFGGGGGAGGCSGASGGGGGYNGGGGGNTWSPGFTWGSGGGGGSFNAGTAQSNIGGDNSGDGMVTISWIGTSTTVPCNGTKTYNYTYTDCSGLSTPWSYTYTIQHTTPPAEVGGPVATSSTVECAADATAPTTLPVFQDVCGNVLTPTGPVTGGTYAGCEGTITYTYTYTDCANLVTTWTYTYTVDHTVAPVLSGVPTGGALGCNPTLPTCATGVTASTPCGPVSVTCSAGTIISNGCNRSQTFTYTATDCDITLSTSQDVTYTWQEVTAPVLAGVPTGGFIGCNPSTLPACDPGVTASNECGALTVNCTPGSVIVNGCNRQQTFTYFVQDPCSGLSNGAVVTYTWNEVTTPVLAGVPTGGALGCNPTLPTCATGVTATNECGSVPVSCTPGTIQVSGCNRTQDFVYSAFDICSNMTASQTVTYTWQEVTAPVLAGVPTGGFIGCNPSTLPACDPGVTASNECGALTVNCTPGSVIVNGCNRQQTFTYFVQDPCSGLSNGAVVTYTWNEVTTPVLAGVPTGGALGCNPTLPTCATGVTATNECGSVPVSCTPGTIMSNGCQQSQDFVYTATDPCSGLSASQTATYTWTSDTTPPVFDPLPAPSTINCPATPSFAAANATDACGTVGLTSSDVTTPGACAGAYSVTRTWIATDGCGNTSSASQTINVIDTDGPVFGALPTLTINCPATPSFTPPNVTDACGSGVTVSVVSTITTPGSCAGNYSVTRTWLATDGCGNTTSASQTINVEDHTGPIFSPLPGPTSINCPNVPIFPTPSISDACGTAIMLSPVDTYVNGPCAGTYTVTRVWTATDDCGNTSSSSQVISVIDNTPPSFAGIPGTTTINCPATPNFATPVVTDACSASPVVTHADVTTPGACAGSYSVTRTWTATDACGNSATASQTINVQDVTGPVFDPIPATSTINCPATPAFVTATATDACGSGVTITSSDVTTPGSCTGSYTVTRTWVATDGCGNSTTASQTIHVQDVTGPVFGPIPAPSAVNCPAGPVFITAVATDGCGGPVVITSYADAITPGACPGTYTATRTWIATDDCGNSTTASQTIHVVDLTGPSITQCAITRNINGIGNAAITGPVYSATSAVSSYAEFSDATNQGAATDNCNNIGSVSYVDAVVSSCPRVIQRTWSVGDLCGNASTCVQTINVIYVTPPSSFAATACDSYTWTAAAATYTTSGSYAHTFMNAAGCDSVVTLNLTVNYSTSGTNNQTVCDTYTWSGPLGDGATYTTSGTYTHTTMNGANCTHTETLNLMVNYSTSGTNNQTACDSYTWSGPLGDGATYTTSGTYTHTSTNAGNCTHTETLNLVVNYSTSGTNNQTVCDSYTWSGPLGDGATYTTSGTYTHTSVNGANCTHTETLNLVVNYSTSGTNNQTVCDTYTWSGPLGDGATYTTSGTYTHTTMNGANCTHTETLNLVVNYSTSGTNNQTVCDTYTWSGPLGDGATYTTSGTYTHTTMNGANCTHTETLNLVVNYSTSGTNNQTACDSYTWSGPLGDGATYTTSGTYTHTSVNGANCTHTETLNLVVNYSTSGTNNQTVCDSYTWSGPLGDGATYTTSGTYTHTSVNGANCTHTETLNLVVNYSTSGTNNQTVCDTYTWSGPLGDGATYTTSGTYTHTTMNGANCTHTETLNLVVNYSTSGTSNQTACDSYTWSGPLGDGATYTTSGTYTHTSTNAGNCTHTETLNLVVNYSTSGTNNQTVCDTYTWSGPLGDGATYTTSGTYTHTSVNGANCTHTETLNLVVNYSTSGTNNQTVCDSYTWSGPLGDGATYTTSGTYTHTSTNAGNCTHTETLNLVVNYSTSSTQNTTAALTYTWPVNGQTYTLSGTYTGTSLNGSGCVHTTTLNLVITGVKISAKVLLDGPYAGGGTMSDVLRAGGLVPTGEPYTGSPFNKANVNDAIPAQHATTLTVLGVTGPTAVVDWVMLELRATTSPYGVLATRRALVLANGNIVDVDGVSPVTFNTVLPGNYRVSVKHRNHLGVMTNLNQSLTLAGTTVDFTTAPLWVKPSSPALVNTPAKVSGGLQILWSGDANYNKNTKYNGSVNDKEAVLAAVGVGTPNNVLYNVYRPEDVNMDGTILYNGFNNDRNVILGTVGAGTPNAIYNQHTPD